MPAAEAAEVALDSEKSSYEFAFHVLPTVAEGEVPSVFDKIKAQITKVGGEISLEESPERVDLVYDIVKKHDGKNLKFSSAYFGWVRFTLDIDKIAEIKEFADDDSSLLRFLIVKLTKEDEENPYMYHEELKANKKVQNVEEDDKKVQKDLTDAEVNKEEKKSEEKEEKKEEKSDDSKKEEGAEEEKKEDKA